ncbi:hypothetical protein O6H91_17G009500 [Diphasiastrum complanatum]|uniref:Uncharacterized protein n=1 Tax=Diphasiastrum complanatum TaxID=34168 RepID=A0ACC2B438_DIPCM|nr:hypothetical protein O6H91_17G009500 [Diphasiastrum complanatum]
MFKVDSSMDNEEKHYLVMDEFSSINNLRSSHDQDLEITQNQDSTLSVHDIPSVQDHSPQVFFREDPSNDPLFVILDLNGVLIKHWDKKPSLPNIENYEGKWLQLRPRCLEFFKKLVSIAKVGIWSTMVFRNVLKTYSYIERKLWWQVVVVYALVSRKLLPK